MFQEDPKHPQYLTAASRFPFLSSVLKLLTGRVLAQMVTIVAAPLLTRLYAPEDIGVLQIFLSLVGIIAVVASLRYELSIPLAKTDEEAAASFILSLMITLTVFILTMALVPGLRTVIAQYFEKTGLATFIWMLPPAVFLSGIGAALGHWAARAGAFGAMSWSGLSTTLGAYLVPIAWVGIFGTSVFALFAGYFIGQLACLLLLLFFIRKTLISAICKTHLNISKLFSVAKEHKKFPIFSAWSGVLNTISRELPPLIFGLYFSTTVVGFYALGERLIGLPINLLGNSISQVFFPSAARAYAETGTLSDIVSSLFKSLVQIGIFPMMALGFLGPTFFKFVFGQEWVEAGTYAQILAIGGFFAFVSFPLNGIFAILNRQEMELRLNVWIFLGRSASLLIGGASLSPKETLSLFVVVSVVFILISMYWKLRLSNVSTVWATKTIIKYMAISCLLLLPIKLVLRLVEDPMILIAGLFCVVACYIIVLLRIDPLFRTFSTKLYANFTSGKDQIKGI